MHSLKQELTTYTVITDITSLLDINPTNMKFYFEKIIILSSKVGLSSNHYIYDF
jgi:hypothetical protein